MLEYQQCFAITLLLICVWPWLVMKQSACPWLVMKQALVRNRAFNVYAEDV